MKIRNVLWTDAIIGTNFQKLAALVLLVTGEPWSDWNTSIGNQLLNPLHFQIVFFLIVLQKIVTTLHKTAESADLVTFTKEILNGNLYFLCSAINGSVLLSLPLVLLLSLKE